MLTRKDFIKKANELIEQYKLENKIHPKCKKLLDKGLEVCVAEYSRIAEQSNPNLIEDVSMIGLQRGLNDN